MVGILGGIGSGKSSVVRQVTTLRLLILDADRIGHDLLDDRNIQAELRHHFGEDIFADSGSVDRKRLAQIVFQPSAQSSAALSLLNSILHPTIRQQIQSTINHASTDVDAIILDAALLLEAGWADQCDCLIFIETPQTVREQRVFETRGWSAEELARREATQWSLERKRSCAHFVVDNSNSIQQAGQQMTTVLQTVIHRRLQNNSSTSDSDTSSN
ncbi:MAG: dephospho-CoA kinase [Planctomycetaceae bacterium]